MARIAETEPVAGGADKLVRVGFDTWQRVQVARTYLGESAKAFVEKALEMRLAGCVGGSLEGSRVVVEVGWQAPAVAPPLPENLAIGLRGPQVGLSPDLSTAVTDAHAAAATDLGRVSEDGGGGAPTGAADAAGGPSESTGLEPGEGELF